jgi:predicted TIM-barrel fold metal-dependent hydrolase
MIASMKAIVDAHAHRYPAEVLSDPAGWALSHGEDYWRLLTEPGSLQGWADKETMLADMDAAGIAHAVIQGWYWQHQETCDEMNATAARWARKNPDRFTVLASVQPAAGAAAVEGVRRALDEGCAGIGELHPWVQGWSLKCEAWLEIVTLCAERNLPVCFHATETVGRAYPGKVATPLQDYVDFARAYPKLNIVLAHWGGGLPFFHLAKGSGGVPENLYYDTAASPLLYKREIWRAVADIAGESRILFGSDYPLRLSRKKSMGESLRDLVNEAEANLPTDAASAVFAQNARRIYHIA